MANTHAKKELEFVQNFWAKKSSKMLDVIYILLISI